MINTFKTINLGQQKEYRQRVAKCLPMASDYSFVNLWCWAEPYGLEWAWDDKLVWIRQTHPELVYWAPVGCWEQVDWCRRLDPSAAITTGGSPAPTRFIRVPEPLVRIWEHDLDEGIHVNASRAHWDYLYSASELTALKGNRFHKKRNLLKQFKKKYDYSFAFLDASLIDQTLALQEKWCQWRNCESAESLAAENQAIVNLLKNWEKFDGISGGLLFVGGDIIAFAIAEYLPDQTLLIHFEKGDPEFKGVYQAINQIFLEKQPVPVLRINREQDLGDAGLRKAKMSYQPVDFIRKSSVTISRK